MRQLLVLVGLFGACVEATDRDDVSGGEADGNGVCADPMYGDGICQLDLGCGIPDIDCYVVFPTDADAAEWVTERWNRPIVPETDPVFTRARMLTDRAWKIFTAEVKLAKLGDQRLGIVVMNDPTINALVLADGAPGMVGLTILIHRGALDSTMTDDEIVGLLLHEITHAVRQHVIEQIANRLHRFYVGGSPEPLGWIQPEQPEARHYGESWRSLAVVAGIVSDSIFDVPLDGDLGVLFNTYLAGLAVRLPACAPAVTRIQRVVPYSRVDGMYVITPVRAHEAADALAQLRDCAAPDTKTLDRAINDLGGEWSGYMEGLLTTSEKAMMQGPALDGLLALTASRRAELRSIETEFATATGKPWSTVRFFSSEEEADDYSARIGKAQHVADVGVTGFMFAVLDRERAACEAHLGGGGPVPYGNLADDHHAACWRIAHARQLVTSGTARPRIAGTIPEPTTPTLREVPRPVY